MKRLLYFLETNSLLVLLLEKWLHDRGHHFEDRPGVVEDEGLDSLGIAILQSSHAEKTINNYTIELTVYVIECKVMLYAVE